LGFSQKDVHNIIEVITVATIRALELGFGSTSLVTGVNENGSPKILTFPSIVSQVDPSKSDLGAGLNDRNTVLVDIKGSKYEIGIDASLGSDKTNGRVLNNKYITSDQYQALLFGSLVYMNETEIDLLVLGLPVENWHRKQELKDLVIGCHEVNGKKYNIKDCWVIVQPMGGLLSHANDSGQAAFSEMREKTILSLDPGFGTWDFICSKGLIINNSRSGGVDQGMSAVLASVARVLKVAFPDLGSIPIEQIDEAFYKHKDHIRIAGRKYPFPVCVGKDVSGKDVDIHFDVRSAISNVTGSALTSTQNKVGAGGDIDLILLMGGPHEVFLNAVKEAYPAHEITVVKNPLTAICTGMYYGGLQYYAATQLKNTAA
jgi:plasmid segregation protein ParM